MQPTSVHPVQGIHGPCNGTSQTEISLTVTHRDHRLWVQLPKNHSIYDAQIRIDGVTIQMQIVKVTGSQGAYTAELVWDLEESRKAVQGRRSVFWTLALTCRLMGRDPCTVTRIFQSIVNGLLT